MEPLGLALHLLAPERARSRSIDGAPRRKPPLLVFLTEVSRSRGDSPLPGCKGGSACGVGPDGSKTMARAFRLLALATVLGEVRLHWSSREAKRQPAPESLRRARSWGVRPAATSGTDLDGTLVGSKDDGGALTASSAAPSRLVSSVPSAGVGTSTRACARGRCRVNRSSWGPLLVLALIGPRFGSSAMVPLEFLDVFYVAKALRSIATSGKPRSRPASKSRSATQVYSPFRPPPPHSLPL